MSQSENLNDVDVTRPLTRREFCVAENISLSTYAKLRRLGHGPKETHYPGMTLVRISVEARQKWQAEREKWNSTKAASLEQARRDAFASAAGRKAAESAKHISKRKKAAAKAAKAATSKPTRLPRRSTKG